MGFYKGTKVSLRGGGEVGAPSGPASYSVRVSRNSLFGNKAQREEPPVPPRRERASGGGGGALPRLWAALVGGGRKSERTTSTLGGYYRPDRLNAVARGGSWKNPPAWPGPSGRLKAWALRVTALTILAGGTFILRTKVTAALQDLAGFHLGQVKVTGLRFLAEEDVLSALNLKPGMDMFSLDLSGASKRVAALPWVERSYLERRLPQSLLVSVTERKPVALVDAGALWAVDAEGRLLPPSARLCGEDLPILEGARVRPEDAGTTRNAESLKNALDLLAFLRKEDPDLCSAVSEIDVSRPEALKTTFLDGVQAVFPPGVGEAEMRRMAAVLSDLALKGRRAQSLDFRFKDQVVVRTR